MKRQYPACTGLLRLGLVRLAEAVPGVGDGEGAIHLRGDLHPIGLPVVSWRWRQTHSGSWVRGWVRVRVWGWLGVQRSHGHRRLRVVEQVGDEHSRHGVLLPAEERKVKLVQVLKTG